jgi:hypothetical protein
LSERFLTDESISQEAGSLTSTKSPGHGYDTNEFITGLAKHERPTFPTLHSRREFSQRPALVWMTRFRRCARIGRKSPPIYLATSRAEGKSVICCFMDGGPSHIDLFDPAVAEQTGRQAAPR